MISSSTVRSDSATIQSMFTSYQSNITTLEDSTVWQGKSKNNFISEAEKFITEFKSPMEKQLSAFADAIDKLEEYKKVKRNIEIASSNYDLAVANNDQPAISKYRDRVNTLKQSKDTLSREIKTKISEVTGLKVNSSPAENLNVRDFRLNKFVYYRQGDYKQAYGRSGTIASAGCGPTSAAMVLTYLTGETVDPVAAAKYSVQHGFRYEGNGTSEGLFPSIASAYGLSCQKQSQTASNIVQSLRNGNVIIAHMGPGEFTSGGHYIVLRGIDDNGNVLVADPANPARNKYYPPSIFEQQSKGSMYSFNV